MESSDFAVADLDIPPLKLPFPAFNTFCGGIHGDECRWVMGVMEAMGITEVSRQEHKNAQPLPSGFMLRFYTVVGSGGAATRFFDFFIGQMTNAVVPSHGNLDVLVCCPPEFTGHIKLSDGTVFWFKVHVGCFRPKVKKDKTKCLAVPVDTQQKDTRAATVTPSAVALAEGQRRRKRPKKRVIHVKRRKGSLPDRLKQHSNKMARRNDF
eukprot:TRINITY_DN67631_c1_g5_i1.p1 TRINITY_DN67631_c1_g5~~TRINITY_DN67631_c1_g5_i1.p1  ORF type:complete len:209 (-),score=8.39 TRINITY_DN67631_c1_g5_i1:32-658(-)